MLVLIKVRISNELIQKCAFKQCCTHGNVVRITYVRKRWHVWFLTGTGSAPCKECNVILLGF